MTDERCENIFDLIGTAAGRALGEFWDHQAAHWYVEDPWTCHYCEDNMNARWAMLGYFV